MTNPLSGDVTIPVLGQVPKVLAYGGPVAVIGLIIWERHKHPATTTATGTTDTTGTTPAATETFSPGTNFDGGGGGTGGGGGGNGGPPFVTNGAWARWVLDYFSGHGYGDQPGRVAAIGLYLSGEAVDAAQKQYIDDAIAIGGRPPVASPTNFPPSIRVTGGQGGTVTVPDLTGHTAGDAHNELVETGLVPVEGEPGQRPADRVTRTSPARGSKVQRGTHVVIYAKGQLAMAFSLKPRLSGENSIIMALATAAFVVGIYNMKVGPVADVHASDAHDGNLAASVKKAGWESLIAVAGLTLLASDPNIIILGGAAIVAEELTYRHALMSDSSGQIAVPHGDYLPAGGQPQPQGQTA